jgi:hypothetical protein
MRQLLLHAECAAATAVDPVKGGLAVKSIHYNVAVF